MPVKRSARAESVDDYLVTSAAGRGLSSVKWTVAPLISYPLSSPARMRASLGIMLVLIRKNEQWFLAAPKPTRGRP